MFPSTKSLGNLAKQDVAELLYLHLCALRILSSEDASAGWSRTYLRKTLRWGNFKTWRSDGNDLYVLMHAFDGSNDRTTSQFGTITTHLFRSIVRGESRQVETDIRRLFVRLDFELAVKDGTLRAIRRLIMNWTDLNSREQKLATTRLLQILRSRAPKSEMLPMLTMVARDRNLELHNVCNLETGEGCDITDGVKPKSSIIGRLAQQAAGPVGFLAGLAATSRIKETATAGSTGSASIAAVPGALGAGFDPNGDHGIYSKKPLSLIHI